MNSSKEVTWNTHKFPEEISCSLCLNIIRQPRTLQCLHSFCLSCLQIYMKQCNDESTFSCPICGQVIHVPDGGLENLGCHTLVRRLLECIEKKPRAENEIAIACEACEDPYSTQYCSDCEQNICDRCAASHKKFKATMSHTVVPSGERRKLVKKDNSTTMQQVSLENSVCDIKRHDKSELVAQLLGGTSTLMEEVSFSISDMEQEISCSLCLSLYLQPKTLPCFHNFCLACLRSHLKYSNDIIKFPCPICRHEADIPDGGLENLGCHTLLKRLIECTQIESKSEIEIPSSCAYVKVLENIHLAVQDSKREQVPAYRNVPSEFRFPAGPIHQITMEKSDEVVCSEKEMTASSATGSQREIKISPRKVENYKENDAIIERVQSSKIEESVILQVSDDAVIKCAAMGQNAEIAQLHDKRSTADYETKLKDDKYRSYVKEIESKETFMNMLKSQQVACFGGSSAISDIRKYTEMNKCFVFFFYMKLKTFEAYKNNFMQLLHETLQKNKNTNNYKAGRFNADAVKFLAVDLEVCQSDASIENIPSGNQICIYEEGKCQRNDCSEEMDRNKTLNLVRIDDNHTEYDEEPMERAIVLLPCPGSLIGTCSSTSMYWLCMECKRRLEYDLLRQVLYCKCGWAPLSAYNFRCESKNHTDFVKYDQYRLKAELSKLQPVKKISLLVLGETGVGKSTWINSIVNYLSFETLKDATEASNIQYRIPASFTITDENFEQKRVTIGKESNEEVSSVKGQSSTQGPKAYMFQAGDVNVTLIDTPGIGDVRGIERDEDNFDKILRFLANIEELHGICILLKPNDARLTIIFKYCINELLTRIHRSAAGNIIFCFTNARGTFYRPGDTLVPLQELLKSVKNTQGVRIELAKRTSYCLDNEAFRFLCAARAGQHFGEDEKKNFSESWNKSRSETVRLFDYIKGLQAHKLIETLSLNEARNIVLQLLQPIAEMSKKIETSIGVLQQRQMELDQLKLDEEGKNLKDKLYIPKLSLIAHKLDFPMTVCTSAKCTETRLIPPSTTSQTIYKTTCHEKCYLKAVTPEVISHPELRRCRAMDNDTCKVCKCKWDVHMHMIQKLELVCNTVFCEETNRLILEGAEQIEIKNSLVRDNQNRIMKLKDSRNTYATITAKFGSFLKASAICTYNDAFEGYIAFRIREETDKVSLGGTDDHLKSLEKVRDVYREQVKLLGEQLKQGHSEKISTEDIFKLRDELYAVEDQGGELKQIVNGIKDASLLIHEHQMRKNFKPKIESKGIMSRTKDFIFRKFFG